MLKILSVALVLSVSLISANIFAQNTIDCGILLKKKMTIEYPNGHSCMTQTRAASNEEAQYNVDKCGPVKYKLSKKGRVFSIYQKDENNKWYKWGSYNVAHSLKDDVNGDLRYVFLGENGSQIFYVPEVEEGPLVILDLYDEDVVHFIYK